jgi:hypothetical protein
MLPNGMIDFSSYGEPMPFSPWGMDGQQEMAKALTAGVDINSPGAVAGSGFPLRPESLDGTLYNLSYRMEHLQLWPQLLKDDVWNTVNEFNVLRQHGSGVAFFHNEGDLPAEDDSIWERLYKTQKSMGCVRAYSIMASMVRMAHANAETHQTLGGTMWVLEQLEKALFTADSSLLPQAFDGYDAQITHVRDLRGKPLTGDEINYGTGVIFDAPNYGKASDLYMPVGVDVDFVEDVLPNARYQVTERGYKDGEAGMNITAYRTQRGPIALKPDVFVEFGAAPASAAVGDPAKRPGTPVESVAMAAAGTGSLFNAADAGTYRYQVIAVNEYGESAPLTLTGTIAVIAGQSVTFTIADGTPVARYYKVFRSEKNGAASTNKYAFKVARSSTGSTQITDANAYIPGTGRCYLIQQNREFNVIQRLLRFMKIRLALVDARYRFMLLLFCALAVHAPNKAMIFINVGRAARTPSYDVS